MGSRPMKIKKKMDRKIIHLKIIPTVWIEKGFKGNFAV